VNAVSTHRAEHRAVEGCRKRERNRIQYLNVVTSEMNKRSEALSKAISGRN
jgi:hypothetical protein